MRDTPSVSSIVAGDVNPECTRRKILPDGRRRKIPPYGRLFLRSRVSIRWSATRSVSWHVFEFTLSRRIQKFLMCYLWLIYFMIFRSIFSRGFFSFSYFYRVATASICAIFSIARCVIWGSGCKYGAFFTVLHTLQFDELLYCSFSAASTPVVQAALKCGSGH